MVELVQVLVSYVLVMHIKLMPVLTGVQLCAGAPYQQKIDWIGNVILVPFVMARTSAPNVRLYRVRLEKRELNVGSRRIGTLASAGNAVLEHINQLIAVDHVRLCLLIPNQLGTKEVGIVKQVMLNLEVAALPSSPCQAGSQRVNCGGTNGGSCTPCTGQTYKSDDNLLLI